MDGAGNKISVIPACLQPFLIILCVIFLLIFIWISQYCHPALDDYSNYLKTRELGYWQAQKFWYQQWSGRYAATALLSLNLWANYSLVWYKIFPVFWIILTGLGFWNLICLILPLHPRNTHVTLALILTCTYFCFMPQPTEGLYWLAGAGNYQFTIVAGIYLYVSYFKTIQTSGKQKILWGILTLFLAAIAMGITEPTTFIHIILLLLFAVYQSYKHPNYSVFSWIVFSIALLGALVMFFAPGNKIRQTHFPTGGHWLAFVEASLFSGFIFMKWLIVKPIGILTVIYAFWRISASDQLHLRLFHQIPPIYSWGLFLFLFWGTHFVCFWSLGFRPPLRVQNVIYCLYILGWLINLEITLPYLKLSYSSFLQTFYTHFRIPALIALFILTSSPLNHAFPAAYQLFSGRLAVYDRMQIARYKYIRQNERDTLYVYPIPCETFNIVCYQDITTNPSHWTNQNLAEYFGKQMLALDTIKTHH